MIIHLQRKYLELQADRDEWKRRALEAEEALKKAAEILGDMARYGVIGPAGDPTAYAVEAELLEAINKPLQNVSQSDKKGEL